MVTKLSVIQSAASPEKHSEPPSHSAFPAFTPQQFKQKWGPASNLKERSGSQSVSDHRVSMRVSNPC